MFILFLCNNIKTIIFKSILIKPLKFRNFIDENKINWTTLSYNPSAIFLLEKNSNSSCKKFCPIKIR